MATEKRGEMASAERAARVKRFIISARNGKEDEIVKMMDEDDMREGEQEELLVVACDEGTGETALMAAAGVGSAACVDLLLQRGAVWNAQDRRGKCAGEYAIDSEHYPIAESILGHAVKCELILGAVQRAACGARDASEASARNLAYLQGEVAYIDPTASATDGAARDQGDVRLVDGEGQGVMMGWETSIMEAHAESTFGAVGGGNEAGDISVLNVGYGLGIVDAAFQRRKPARHTIIEAHPTVIKRITDDGLEDGAGGVRVIHARWQDACASLASEGPPQFDIIFWDTFGEYYEDMREFHAWLPRLLKPNGVYSFFNGLAPDNFFFQAVYAQIITLELARMGIEAEFAQLEIRRPEGDTWEGVRSKYFDATTYYLPVCRRTAEGEVGR